MDNYRKTSLRQLECNLDDLNPEFYPFIIERLLAAGARDAWITPVIMKGGRPACKLSSLYLPELEEKICRIIFDETTSLGLRCFDVERYELERSFEEVQTSWGPISVKIAKDSSGCVKAVKPEFSSCEQAARQSGAPLKQVYQELLVLCREFWK